MTSSISSSELQKGIGRKLLLSLATAALVFVLAESACRLWPDGDNETLVTATPADLIAALPHVTVQGRERDNQMLAQNVTLFSAYPAPDAITTAFIGTSRSKVLRPMQFGMTDAVNASGNSYNEISYGLLLQAEALRLQFPNLKRVYFEASLLLRRPDRLIVEADHRKYLPLLASLLPLRDRLPDGDSFRQQVMAAQATPTMPVWKSKLDSQRNRLRLTTFLQHLLNIQDDDARPVTQDPLFKTLRPNGERISPAGPAVAIDRRVPSIAEDNIKVQRLRDIPEWTPWDHLFEMIALWGQAHQIEVVLYQPPVRSDLYAYQLKHGLDLHVTDLHRVAQTYNLPFIDLNQPALHYGDDWALFLDEDHMETCEGVTLLQAAILEGARRFGLHNGEPLALSQAEVRQLAEPQLQACSTDHH